MGKITDRFSCSFVAGVSLLLLMFASAQPIHAQGSVAAPTPITPTNGALNVGTLPLFTWSSVPGAEYWMEVSDSASVVAKTGEFVTKVRNHPYGQTQDNPYWQIKANLPRATKLYWHVRAKVNNQETAWSDMWSFTTINQLVAPTLNSPADGAAGLSLPVQLSWDAEDGMAGYRLQIATNQSMTALLVDDNTLTASSYTATILSGGVAYFWRVQVSDGTYWSEWSRVWAFSTQHPLAVPQPTAPANGAAGIALPPTLQWGAVNSATSYSVQLARDAAFTQIVASNAALTATQYSPTGLTAGTVYYWRVSAATGSRVSDWSLAWSFTAALPTPVYQPDLMIQALQGGQLIGSGQYDTNGSQEADLSTHFGNIAVFPLTLRNDGNCTDSIILTCTLTGKTGWGVHFFTADGREITRAVEHIGWRAPNLAPGGTVNLRLEITPESGLLNGDAMDVVVRATSWLHNASADTVKAVATKTADPGWR